MRNIDQCQLGPPSIRSATAITRCMCIIDLAEGGTRGLRLAHTEREREKWVVGREGRRRRAVQKFCKCRTAGDCNSRPRPAMLPPPSGPWTTTAPPTGIRALIRRSPLSLRARASGFRPTEGGRGMDPSSSASSLSLRKSGLFPTAFGVKSPFPPHTSFDEAAAAPRSRSASARTTTTSPQQHRLWQLRRLGLGYLPPPQFASGFGLFQRDPDCRAADPEEEGASASPPAKREIRNSCRIVSLGQGQVFAKKVQQSSSWASILELRSRAA